MLSELFSEKNLPWTTAAASLVAAVAALGAWFVTWGEVRRCNRVIVRLRKLASRGVSTLQGDAYELEVRIHNVGMPIQNVSIELGFYGPGRSGIWHLRIPRAGESESGRADFLRGTTARFVVSTRDVQSCQMLGDLQDLAAQKPVINVYNNGFLATSFSLQRRFDTLRQRWNRLSFRLAFERRVGDGHDGKGVFKRYQLPYFEIRSEKLGYFLEGVNKSVGAAAAGGGASTGGKAQGE